MGQANRQNFFATRLARYALATTDYVRWQGAKSKTNFVRLPGLVDR